MRTCLAVPGSNARMLARAAGTAADQVCLDLEDAVVPALKEQARADVAHALREHDWLGKTRSIRVNDLTTSWTYLDVLAVVGAAGACLDTIVLPKTQGPDQVRWLDVLLRQVEANSGLEVGRIGIEAQIENAAGLNAVESIASASPRLRALLFGPADFTASLGMRVTLVGEQPAGYDADAYHYIRMRILMAARAAGIQAIDGPYLGAKDVEGTRRAAARAAALGFDGTWVLHPGQIDVANTVFTPTQEEYDRAELLLTAYAHHTSAAGGARGAVMFGAEMIDEASRKQALTVAAKGRAAGLEHTTASRPG